MDDPHTASEFREEMAQLVRAAHDNGIDVTGGWDIRNESDYPDWSFEGYEVVKPHERR